MTPEFWTSVVVAFGAVGLPCIGTIIALIRSGAGREARIAGLLEDVSHLKSELNLVYKLTADVHEIKRDAQHDLASVRRHHAALGLEVRDLERDTKGDLKMILEKMGGVGERLARIEEKIDKGNGHKA